MYITRYYINLIINLACVFNYITGFRVGWARANPEVVYNLSKLQVSFILYIVYSIYLNTICL